MPLFRIQYDGQAEIKRTDFVAARVREREDLQRLLRDQIQVLDRDLYVLSEEFGRWQEGNRRIDLLAIDRNANLVVIELKRTDHGGHMDLQAIRYAAMVSNMTFEQAVRAHNAYLSSRDIPGDSEQQILDFLGWEEANEEDFAPDVRILLVSGDFSGELTTSVLWLNEKGLDIRCVRLRPYKIDSELVVQVEQVLPLPEAQDYIIGVREKQRSEAKSRSRDFTKFDVEIAGKSYSNLAKRQAIVRVAKRLCECGASPEDLASTSGRPFNSVWRCAEGELSSDELSDALVSQANSGGPAFDPRRWFTEEEFLIHSDGKTWAFTKMWGQRTEEIMISWLEHYPNSSVKITRTK